jgi:hypothetical protein
VLSKVRALTGVTEELIGAPTPQAFMRRSYTDSLSIAVIQIGNKNISRFHTLQP